jgi:polyisoprenoid-binding protein YceI
MADLSALTPGTWNIDTAHTTVGFSVRHLMISKVRGRFTAFTGAVEIAADPLQSSVTVDVEIASIKTGDSTRDGHLKTGDFFDAEQYPTMSFRSTGIAVAGSNYALTGDLTLHGVTKPVTFALEYEGVGSDPWGGTRAGFTATTEISRKDFGLEYNAVLETGGVMIGDTVKVELEVEAVRA